MSTFLQLYTEVLNYGADTTNYTSRVKAWINEGQHRACRQLLIRELYVVSDTTSNASGIVAVPSNFMRMDAVEDTANDVRLRPIEPRLYDQLPTSTNSQPYLYAMDSGGIQLYPWPTTSYAIRLRYWQDPAELVNDADVSILPTAYHHMLISYAVARFYLAEDDAQMFQVHMGDYQTKLAQLQADRQSEVRDGPTLVRGTWGDPHDISSYGAP